MRPFLTLSRIEFSLLTRDAAAVVFTLALPLVLLSMQGGDNLPRERLGGAGNIDVATSAYAFLIMLTTGLMALPETLAAYRQRGFFRRLLVSPLRPWQIVGSQAVTHLAMTGLGLVLLVGLGALAFDLNPPASWSATLLALAASLIMVIAVGLLLGACLPTVNATRAVASVIYFPAIFVSGAITAREYQPEFARLVGEMLPFTYAVRLIREAWTLGSVDVSALGIVAATTLAAGLLALRLFRWEPRS